jgi:hypothetical protein
MISMIAIDINHSSTQALSTDAIDASMYRSYHRIQHHYHCSNEVSVHQSGECMRYIEHVVIGGQLFIILNIIIL